MKYVKLFEEFSTESHRTCDIMITGCTPWDSNVGHWLTHEHVIRVKILGSKLEDPNFDDNKDDYALGSIQKGEFEILMDDKHTTHVLDVEEVFDLNNIIEISKISDDLEEFARILRNELYDVTREWFNEQENEEDKEDDSWITPDNTGAISEVMGSPRIVWY
jgi:hypothetical protein